MSKGIKIVLGTIVPILAICVSWVGWRLTHYPTQTIPYPYFFDPHAQNSSLEAQLEEKAAQSQILIVGDRMAKDFERFEESLSQEVSKKLSTPLKVASIGVVNEGLHRTLNRLKMLKKVPKIIIYLGGSQELYEQKFYPAEERRIKKNFELYQNPKLRTLIHLWPTFSKFIYLSYKRLTLGPTPVEIEKNLDGSKFQRTAELSFILYQTELSELIHWAQEKEIHLVFITTPINLEIRPKLVCENAISEEILAAQEKILEFIKISDFKSAYASLQKIMPLSPGNAMGHFLNGFVSKKLGNYEQAMRELELASAYDCLPWRSTPVFNSIILSKARDYEINAINFHQLIYEDWDKNILFSSEIFPQDLYYQKLVKEIAHKLAPILGTNMHEGP